MATSTRSVYMKTATPIDVTDAPQDHKDVNVSLDVGLEDIIQEVEPTNNVYGLAEKAQQLAFMEEPVKIFLYEGSGQFDEPFVHIQINGENPLPNSPRLKRGQEYVIKRKFVDHLARMRPVSYTQPYKGGGNPDLENIYRPQVSVKYPFSVLEDRNPAGAKWLKSVMGQG